KSPRWPRRRSSCLAWPPWIARGRIARSCARRAPRKSNAPARIKVSAQPLPTSRVETRSKKSSRLLKGPVCWRALTIASTAFTPTPLIAPKPKRHSTLVDVGRQHFDAHPPAVVDVLDEELVALGAVHLRRQHRGHVLGGIMTLQVGSLVGDQRVG